MSLSMGPARGRWSWHSLEFDGGKPILQDPCVFGLGAWMGGSLQTSQRRSCLGVPLPPRPLSLVSGRVDLGFLYFLLGQRLPSPPLGGGILWQYVRGELMTQALLGHLCAGEGSR